MISEYLYYSYDPGCPRSGLSKVIRSAARSDPLTGNRSELIAAGKNALKRSVDRELETSRETNHVVPLSAGLDSRAILAVLLDHQDVDPSNITTVSFGTPGTWDFEIGQEVAQTAGVKNIAIDITAEEFDWSVSSLRQYVRERERPVRVLEGYVNAKILDQAAPDAVVWSGFMGDPTAGGHQPATPSENWENAREYFVDNNQFSDGLAAPDFEPEASLPREPYLSRAKLSYEEQLDFAHRQRCLIAPLVVPTSGRYNTPFLQSEWLSFSLNLPEQHRQNRSMFKDIVTELSPDLFALPTDANRGLPLNTGAVRELVHRTQLFTKRNLSRAVWADYLPPSTNYLRFAKAFRESGELQTAARTLIKDIANREIVDWVKPQAIWESHQSGTDRANEIRALCTVELIYSETNLL
jgi:asparagine synthetase B (glutamine-hydrolysing)